MVEELEALENEYKKNSFSFFVIYGRRRIGKTELLNEFSRDKPNVYFLADKRGTKNNVLKFRKKVSEFLNEPEIASENFEEIFGYLSKKWEKKEKLVIIIDEFSFLVEKDDSIPSLFQSIVDEKLSKKTNIFLILCGSSISMMEKGVLSYKSPLYGRRTGQWKVNQMGIKEALLFFPKLSKNEIVVIYSIFGGVPFYLNLLDQNKTIYENVEENFLSKNGLLYTEGDFLLKEELKDPSTFFSILLAMASGATRISEIGSKSFIKPKDLPYYMRILEELELIKRENPILEKKKTKKTLYFIKDNFLSFWFRFVYPFREEVETGNSKYIIKIIKNNMDNFVSRNFEFICREFLFKKKILNFEKIGSQWGKIQYKPKGENEYQIDIVALNEGEKKIGFFECKWKDLSEKESQRLLDELKEKSKFADWNKSKRKEYFGLIARKIDGKKELRDKGYLIFDLEDF